MMPSIHCMTKFEPRNGVSCDSTDGVPSRGTSMKLVFFMPSWPYEVVAIDRGAAVRSAGAVRSSIDLASAAIFFISTPAGSPSS